MVYNSSPLLIGENASRARAAARAVGRALAAHTHRAGRPDLQGGDAGLAIVFAALDEAFPEEGYVGHAARAIERAIASTERDGGGAGLWTGFTGVTWALALLQGTDIEEPDNAVDAALAELVAKPWRGTYDMIGGLCGFGVYALERTPRPSACALLAAIVDLLAEASERRCTGLTWRSRREWSPPELPDEDATACDLGVAHGVPGVIALLGRTCAAEGIAAETKRRARALLDGAVPWLLAQELPPGAGGCFATRASEGSRPRPPSKLAWCRGDPGVASALGIAARCTGERAWLDEAKRIALVAATRPFDRAGVEDATLCHGSAGLGHMFHRLYRATNDARLAAAARVWLMRAVDSRSDDARYGWTCLAPTRSGRMRRASLPGVLLGAGGIALALLAATGDAGWSWDRALGLSAPEIGD